MALKHMDKALLRDIIVVQLESIKQAAVNAANQAHETATHSEAIARSKYETFGLEASYLAHGQTQRVAECQLALQQINGLVLRDFDADTAIGLGALVILEDELEQLQALFISPAAGGVKVQWPELSQYHNDINNVMLVTPAAPLGQALMAKYVDDEVVLTGQNKQYQIIAVY